MGWTSAFWLFFLLTPPLFAQLRGLATTTDGSRLYFISNLRQRETDQHVFEKVFLLDERGPTLAAEPAKPGPDDLDLYYLTWIQTTEDGSNFLYGLDRPCSIGGFRPCVKKGTSATLVAGSSRTEIPGAASLSRNGRWLVRYSAPAAFHPANRIDRETGETVSLLPFSFGGTDNSLSGPLVVGSNGEVLIPFGSGLALWTKAGGLRQLAQAAQAAVMDDAATTVVYEPFGVSGWRQLAVVDVASGRSWTLGSPHRNNYLPSVSSDGQWVLYLSKIPDIPQLFFSRRDGTAWRQLTNGRSGIAEAVLSGDGRLAWAVTGDGAVVRIDTASGAAEQRIAALPALYGRGVNPSILLLEEGAPGSSYTITGRSLAPRTATATPPLPEELGGVRLMLNGRALPLYFVSPSRIVFQIPWDVSPTPPVSPGKERNSVLALRTGVPSLESAVFFSVVPEAPRPEPYSVPVAIHEDFSSLVTANDPARPGEIVHLYATGLGPVEPPVPTGLPGLDAPLSRLALDWTWQWYRSGEPPSQREGIPADVLFAGLAPALVGYYQIDVRIPQGLQSGIWALRVRRAGAGLWTGSDLSWFAVR
ncbi:MAG: hypothetical protein ACKV22_18700 [Bryobacteraceae bacterium]